MEEQYETRGVFYVTPTMQGDRSLVSMDKSDYEPLMAHGMLEKEVAVTLRKAKYGSEYEQKVPQHRAKGSCYTVKMDASLPKPQISLSIEDTTAIRDCGIGDLDEVSLLIEKLPYDVPAEADYSGLVLDVNL